ncbi:unnamed protein product [Nesidiocoris tenuis]|uniref:Uncharacterized protein n=1 Tax=Nesidiocoris tenuis TaxID=355587 RepID=A0A6H5H9W4_9HEMI|nr:unnamed protein product [Nesidiocoris tenuis]
MEVLCVSYSPLVSDLWYRHLIDVNQKSQCWHKIWDQIHDFGLISLLGIRLLSFKYTFNIYLYNTLQFTVAGRLRIEDGRVLALAASEARLISILETIFPQVLELASGQL